MSQQQRDQHQRQRPNRPAAPQAAPARNRIRGPTSALTSFLRVISLFLLQP